MQNRLVIPQRERAARGAERIATFFFLWMNGKEEKETGESVADAFEKLGHNEKELEKLAYFREV